MARQPEGRVRATQFVEPKLDGPNKPAHDEWKK
jgi:hypothetical protein